jgi:hypothetical protein
VKIIIVTAPGKISKKSGNAAHQGYQEKTFFENLADGSPQTMQTSGSREGRVSVSRKRTRAISAASVIYPAPRRGRKSRPSTPVSACRFLHTRQLFPAGAALGQLSFVGNEVREAVADPETHATARAA